MKEIENKGIEKKKKQKNRVLFGYYLDE